MAGLFACVGTALLLSGIGRWLAISANPQPADAIVVLGGDYPSRILHGILLFHQGFGPELWHTGDVSPPGNELSLAQFAIRISVDKGVPPTALKTLATSSTWEDGRKTAALARSEDVHSLLIVTSWYHSRRALCVFHHHFEGSGITINYDTTTQPPFAPETWWLHPKGWLVVPREVLAIGYYWFQYGLTPWQC